MRYYLEYDLYDIKKLSKDEQIQIMKNWFFSNYQDPQYECPYDKEEGDYVYIYGGPFDAREELIDEFGDYIDEEIIEELVDELENECYEWSGIDFGFNNEYNEIEVSNIDPLVNLKNSIATLEKLLEIEYDNELTETLYNMITANCITILEAFLSEFLLNKVLNDDLLLKKSVENIVDFKEVKISINELFIKYNDVKNIVKKYLSDLCYHNLSKISKIYTQILDVTFPKEIGGIYKMIENRHDIVHRNGKRKDGSKIIISKENIQKLFDDINSLAEFINNNIPKYNF